MWTFVAPFLTLMDESGLHGTIRCADWRRGCV